MQTKYEAYKRSTDMVLTGFDGGDPKGQYYAVLDVTPVNKGTMTRFRIKWDDTLVATPYSPVVLEADNPIFRKTGVRRPQAVLLYGDDAYVLAIRSGCCGKHNIPYTRIHYKIVEWHHYNVNGEQRKSPIKRRTGVRTIIAYKIPKELEV